MINEFTISSNLIDTTPEPRFDYKLICRDCGAICFLYAWQGDPFLRETPLPKQYAKPNWRIEKAFDYEGEEYELDIPVCPACGSARFDKMSIGGPHPLTHKYVQELKEITGKIFLLNSEIVLEPGEEIDLELFYPGKIRNGKGIITRRYPMEYISSGCSGWIIEWVGEEGMEFFSS